jgi:3-isopropylmalate/(R)-2-methylmalate dehydratase large subunit
MTLSNKVLADAASIKELNAGENIKLNVDYCLIDDAQSNTSINFLKDEDTLFNKNKVIVAIDHDTPSGSVEAAKIQKKLIEFAKKNNTLLHNGEGIGYQLMLEKYIEEGHIAVGCGSHTAIFGAKGALGFKVSPEKLAEVLKTGYLEITAPEILKVQLAGKLNQGVYSKDVILEIIRTIGSNALEGKIIEFVGSGLSNLTEEDLITICSLAGKTGAVSAIVNLDKDNNSADYKFDLGNVKALVVKPHSYDEIVEAEQLKEIAVNEVFIGGNTGGKIEDLRVAAEILKGKKIAYRVRVIVAPVTSSVYIAALQEGLIETFIDAGCLIMNQGWSVDWGKSQGIIDTNEVLVSAGTCNSKGNAGAETAKIYISSPATAAMTALTGFICPQFS